MEWHKNQLLGLFHKSAVNSCLAETGYQVNFKGLAADFNSPEFTLSTVDKTGT